MRRETIQLLAQAIVDAQWAEDRHEGGCPWCLASQTGRVRQHVPECPVLTARAILAGRIDSNSELK